MSRLIAPLGAAVAAIFATVAVTSLAARTDTASYAEDRAAIENLQARYLFAMDFHDIDGNEARGRAYWFHYSNDTPDRSARFDGFGHYEDELVKVDGHWLFSKRRIYNENRDVWAYKGGDNPAW